MGQVSATSSAVIEVKPDQVLAALSDYQTVRPRILTDHFRDYRVLSGGVGDGTVAQWTLQATSKRSRDIKATVTVAGHTITERDANSSLVTRWTVEPSGAGSLVTTTTEWQGAGGVGGFFERIFAPLGLKKIQSQLLDNLRREVA
ncbi:SRPBCC family protein [Skermania sp. ID1734]|uniref:SRPBCC family protein n=1 Tax=Skermania sp. ID1734 TaxID=2597516 RepID=UPI0011803363|nr:SRPBCC family protein [Skermania sp. ID1734]TSE00640.1 SRPBCC family protein [Skermania sp. ID1734]